MTLRLRTLGFAASLLLLGTAGGGLMACASDDPASGEEDLTSLTARQRILTFEGIVYVEKGMKDPQILEVVHRQTKTAFGALLNSEVMAQTREFQNVKPASFKKRDVKVVDPNVENDPGRDMLEVRYTYTDNAVVPVAMARKTALPLAVLAAGSDTKTEEIVQVCTKNDKEAREDAEAGLLWYNFNPAKASCRHAIEKEQKTIEEDTASLPDEAKMVSVSRANRTYIPVNMKLGKADTAERATYPDYDRLFAGPSQPGVLTLTLIAGRLAHKKVEARKDGGYFEWLSTLDVLFTEHPEFTLTKIEPETNISTISAEGKKFDNLGFKDFIEWTVRGRGFPEGMPPSSRDNIKKTVAAKLDSKWVTFEKKVKVSIGGAPPKDLTIRLETLFGAEEAETPHKRAIKRGDVFIYNGHSYIGAGPLDPANFTKDDFTPGYQLLWFDSCVSYNYYEKDFFGFKANGSKDLDLITNALEAPEFMSGDAEGRFISRLIDGSTPSYQTLLELAKDTDALRVVDGELDNKFDPKKTSIKIIK